MSGARKVELAVILGSGLWSLGVLSSFALGNARLGYMMLGLGAIAGTSIALVRAASEPEPILELAEELRT